MNRTYASLLRHCHNHDALHFNGNNTFSFVIKSGSLADPRFREVTARPEATTTYFRNDEL